MLYADARFPLLQCAFRSCQTTERDIVNHSSCFPPLSCTTLRPPTLFRTMSSIVAGPRPPPLYTLHHPYRLRVQKCVFKGRGANVCVSARNFSLPQRLLRFSIPPLLSSSQVHMAARRRGAASPATQGALAWLMLWATAAAPLLLPGSWELIGVGGASVSFILPDRWRAPLTRELLFSALDDDPHRRNQTGPPPSAASDRRGGGTVDDDAAALPLRLNRHRLKEQYAAWVRDWGAHMDAEDHAGGTIGGIGGGTVGRRDAAARPKRRDAVRELLALLASGRSSANEGRPNVNTNNRGGSPDKDVKTDADDPFLVATGDDQNVLVDAVIKFALKKDTSERLVERPVRRDGSDETPARGGEDETDSASDASALEPDDVRWALDHGTERRNVAAKPEADTPPRESDDDEKVVPSETAVALRRLAAILPDDALWQDAFVSYRRIAAGLSSRVAAAVKRDAAFAERERHAFLSQLHPCRYVREVECNGESRIVRLYLRRPRGRLVWSALADAAPSLNALFIVQGNLSAVVVGGGGGNGEDSRGGGKGGQLGKPAGEDDPVGQEDMLAVESSISSDSGGGSPTGEGGASITPSIRELYCYFTSIGAPQTTASGSVSRRRDILPTSQPLDRALLIGCTDLAWQLPPTAELSISRCGMTPTTDTGNRPSSLTSLPKALLIYPLRVLNITRCGLQWVPWRRLAHVSSVERIDLSYNAIVSLGAVEAAAAPSDRPRSSLPSSGTKSEGGSSRLPPRLLLPSRVTSFRAAFNGMVGTIDTARLPADLETLDVEGNRLSGRFDISRLPSKLAFLNLRSNLFSGPVNFRALPESARYIYLQSNRFSGTPDLTLLPIEVRRVLIGDNNWDAPHGVQEQEAADDKGNS